MNVQSDSANANTETTQRLTDEILIVIDKNKRKARIPVKLLIMMRIKQEDVTNIFCTRRRLNLMAKCQRGGLHCIGVNVHGGKKLMILLIILSEFFNALKNIRKNACSHRMNSKTEYFNCPHRNPEPTPTKSLFDLQAMYQNLIVSMKAF